MADLTQERVEELRAKAERFGCSVGMFVDDDEIPGIVSMASRLLAAEARLADAEKVVEAARDLEDGAFLESRSPVATHYLVERENYRAFRAALDTYTAKHGGSDG